MSGIYCMYKSWDNHDTDRLSVTSSIFYIVVDLLTKQGSTRISTGSQIPPMLTPELEAMSRDNQMLTVDSRVAAMFLSTEHGALSDQRRWSLVLTLSLWCGELICSGECCPVWHSWYTNVIDCPSLPTKYSYFTFKRLKVQVIFDVAIFIKHNIYIDGNSKKVRQAQIGYLQCYFYSTLLLTKKYTNNIRYCKVTFPYFLPKYRNTHRLYHLLLWAAVTNL